MTLATVLLPVVLMLGKALVDIFVDDARRPARRVLDVVGTPLIALLIAVVVAMFTLGRGAGMDRSAICEVARASRCPPIAGILLIVAAGGGFKQSLVDTGIGEPARDWVADSGRLGAAAGLARRGADPPRHRLGDGRDDHRRRAS